MVRGFLESLPEHLRKCRCGRETSAVKQTMYSATEVRIEVFCWACDPDGDYRKRRSACYAAQMAVERALLGRG